MLLFISSVLLGLGMMLVDLNTSIDRPDHFSMYEDSELLSGRVIDSPQEKKKSTKAVLHIEHALVNNTWVPVEGDLLVYLEKSEQSQSLEIGDEISFVTAFREVEGPANPGQFNYKRFLSFKDIYHQQYLRSEDWIMSGKNWSLRRSSERIRSFFIERLRHIEMDRSEMAIASALLLGKKDDLDPELIQSYASAGAMHVLAVSGLHVGIIFFILRFLFKWMDRWKRGVLIKSMILILCLWTYAFITGLSPSVVRAATMFSAVTLGTGLNRKSDIYNTVASSAFVLLVVNPFYIMEVGFQLSYLAVVGIIYLHPKIYGLLYFPQWLPDKIWEISCVSIAAQLATFPLGLMYFHQFPSYFLLSNLLVIPAAFLILYLGIIYLVLGWIPVVGIWLGKLLSGTIWVLNQGVSWIEGIPYSLIKGIDIDIVMCWVIYAVVMAMIIALNYRKKQWFFFALIGMTGILGWQIYESMSFKRHPHLVVYDVRGESVINFLHSSENLIYSDSTWQTDKSKQQFHLRNCWNMHGAPEPQFFRYGEHPEIEWVNEKTLIYQDCSLVLFDSRWNQETDSVKVPVDYLVVSYHRGITLEPILETIDPDLIILDGTIRGRTIERLRGEVGEHALHVINEDGYFRRRI
ncbi:MAG: ComEC family competence protein [Flavobacteriales bacterium]|nr:ComEC family competence protein [Flavobacteriales bacterium]